MKDDERASDLLESLGYHPFPKKVELVAKAFAAVRADERSKRIKALYEHRATLLDMVENAGDVTMGPVGRRRLKEVENQINQAEIAERDAREP